MRKGVGKRGISNVVVAILLILLSITAVIIVWVVVKNIIEKSEPDISVVTSDVKIIYINIDEDNLATIKLQRLAGAGEVVGVRFAFYNETDSYIYDDKTSLNELETRTYEISLVNPDSIPYITDVNKVDISLILKTGEQEKLSPIKSSAEKQGDKWVISGGGGGGSGGGGGGTPCTTDCAGKFCGSDGCGGSCGPCGAGESCNANYRCEASCVLTSARWGTISAIEGDSVQLIVEGENCDGKELSFEVWENDLWPFPDNEASNNPANAVFSAGQATTTWAAEWQDDCFGLCNPPEYYFIASLVSNSNTKITSANEVEVSQSAEAVCGNDICEPGEDEFNCPGECAVETGLIAYYKLNGNVNDETGNYPGTNNGATFTIGKVGNAASFDGINDYVKIGGDNSFKSLTQGTIAGWIKTDLADIDFFFGVGSTTDSCQGLLFWINIDTNGNLDIRQRNACPTTELQAGLSASGTNFEANKWYYLAYTVNSSGNSFYINGVKQALSYSAGSTTSNFFFDDIATTQNYWIGGGKYGGTGVNRFGYGLIDEFKIYNRALSASEILDEFNNGACNHDSVCDTADGEKYGNCPSDCPPCTLASASWSTSSTTGREPVDLIVTGTGCDDGESVSFNIYEDDNLPGEDSVDDPVVSNPANAVFSSGQAVTTWAAEYQTDDAGNPEYYFVASSVSSGRSINSDAPELEVGPCVPKTCSQLGYECQVQDDGCGNPVNCGSCSGTDICIAGNCRQVSGELLFFENFEDNFWPGTWESASLGTWPSKGYDVSKGRYFLDLGTKEKTIGKHYTYLDTTSDYECTDGKCLRGIFQINNANGVNNAFLTVDSYALNRNAEYNSQSVIGKSLPHGSIDLYVKEISGCVVEFRPLCGPTCYAEATIKKPMIGWQTFTTSYMNAQQLSSQSMGFGFVLMAYPPAGKPNITNCYIEYYVDNYKVYGDSNSENDHWISLAKQFINNPQGDRGEVTTTITSSGPSNNINIKVVPGEPEAFSVVINEGLGLTNVYPSISNLVGPGTIPSSNIEVKWISKWKNFKFNNPALGGQDVIEVDANSLQTINIPGGNSNKVWFSLSTPANVVPGIYTGTARISYGSASYYNIPVNVEVLGFSLDEPIVKVGLYITNAGVRPESYNNEWTSALDWLYKAGIRNTYISGGPPYGPKCGIDASYSQQNVYNDIESREQHGLTQENLILSGLLNHEMDCFFGTSCSGDITNKYRLYEDGSWIGPSLECSLEQMKQYLSNKGFFTKTYLYSIDESQGWAFFRQLPIMEIGKDYGYKWAQAIHPSVLFEEVNFTKYKSDIPNRGIGWNRFTGKYGMTGGDYIDFAITYERNYLFSKYWQSKGKINGNYAYPFTDAHTGTGYQNPPTADGYEAEREEFWRTYLAGANYYYNYAFDDVRDSSYCIKEDANKNCIQWGALFGSGRKMGLLLPERKSLDNPKKYVDGMSSEGFIRGYWDMRYLNTLIKLVEQKEISNPGNADVVAARDFIDIINTKRGWQQFKYDMINEIIRLNNL